MNILNVDFNELYIEQKQLSDFKPKTREEWDAKAEDLNKRIHQSIYNEQFLSCVNTSDANTLLDVGCGPGNLALRFARKLETVYAMDYSSQMLRILSENAASKKIENIKTFAMSWEDEWACLPKADIVIASRSMEVSDMKRALIKLDAQALKKVYLTYKVGGSFLDMELLDFIGKEIIPKPDYIYILNILYSLGINAQVSFLESENNDLNIKTYEGLQKRIEWSLGELTEEQTSRLKRYFDEGKKPKQSKIGWALISWEKE